MTFRYHLKKTFTIKSVWWLCAIRAITRIRSAQSYKALTHLGWARFIAWRSRFFFGGMPTAPRAFLCPPYLSGLKTFTWTHLKNSHVPYIQCSEAQVVGLDMTCQLNGSDHSGESIYLLRVEVERCRLRHCFVFRVNRRPPCWGIVCWLFCFTAYQPFSGHLKPN